MNDFIVNDSNSEQSLASAQTQEFEHLRAIRERLAPTRNYTAVRNLAVGAREFLSSLHARDLWHSAKQSCLGLSLRGTRRFVRNLRSWAFSRRVVLPDVQHIAESMAAIDASSSPSAKHDSDTEAPIFVLASGWRTGSTLLQRILVTDPTVLLWGEPLGDLGLLSNVAEMLAQVPTFHKLNRCAIAGKPADNPMAISWIANLCPPGEDFRSALRMLFDSWLRGPAVQRGYKRWGFKEVRLGAPEAMLLHWLYPRAKFLLLTRHPYDCYRSLADSGWDQVYHQRPDVQVDSAVDFARHWNRLAVSWSELPQGFPCLRIKYEDVIRGNIDFRRLEDWLDIKIVENIALSVVIGRTSSRSQLGWHERWVISREAGPGMQSFGYVS